MIKLYHFAQSTCSQKVRLVLAHKEIDYHSHEIDLVSGGQHDPEYVKLNPDHVVPTLVHEREVLTESSRIIEYLDDAFPKPPMRPFDPLGRFHTSKWLQFIDQVIHKDAPTLTFALGAREAILSQPEELREANISQIQNAEERSIRRSVIESGIYAPEFKRALDAFITMIDRLEIELQGQAWVSGDKFGLVDAAVLPYVLRLEDMSLHWLFEDRLGQQTSKWLKAVKKLPAYEVAVRRWQIPTLTALMRKASATKTADVKQLLKIKQPSASRQLSN